MLAHQITGNSATGKRDVLQVGRLPYASRAYPQINDGRLNLLALSSGKLASGRIRLQLTYRLRPTDKLTRWQRAGVLEGWMDSETIATKLLGAEGANWS